MNHKNQAGQTERLRQELHRDINANKVDIDKNVFKKSKHEKEMLKIAKMQHKNSLSSRII